MTLSVHIKKALKIAEPEATKARLSEGRHWIGLKNIEAPEATQPRDGIFKPWADDLSRFRRDGSQFPPARVYQLSDGRLILAEGHHRRWSLLNDNETDMLCDIVDGTMEEAIVYAAGSNRSNGVKPMSSKDVAKAVEMLFGIPSWWKKSNRTIASHAGCSTPKVTTLRAQYAQRHGLSIPTHVETSDGKVMAACHWKRSQEGYPRIREHSKSGWQAYIDKTPIYGTTIEEVQRKIDEHLNLKRKQVRSLDPKNIRKNLLKRGFIVAPINFGIGRIGMIGHGIVATTCNFGDITISESIGIAKLCSAVGKSIAGRQSDRMTTRSVILCYPAIGPKRAIELFEQAGYEFMTPEEFITSFGPVIPEELKSDV